VRAVSDVDPYVTIARLAATRDSQRLAFTLSTLDSPAREIIETLGRHTLIRQILAVLGDGDTFLQLPDALRAGLEEWRYRRWPSTPRLVAVYTHASSTLHRAGVPALLLKGFHFACRLYGDVAHRPQFDIDLLVRGRDFKRAIRALEDARFERHGYDAHSRTLRFDGVKLDLHRTLVRAPVFGAGERGWWASAVTAHAGPLTFRTLSDDWALVQLLHGTYEDVGQGMARLRQLADLFLLVRDLDGTFDWDTFFAHRRTEAFDVVALNVLALLTTLFGAAGEWPRLSAVLDAQSGSVVPDSTQRATELVFARRKHARNLEWFASIYPGNLSAYLAWFWFHGFPANVSSLSLPRVVTSVQAAFRHRRSVQSSR
jgi:hypothetical protein